jgi:hypothetical protein
MLNPRAFLAIPCLAAAIGVVSVSDASAQQVRATAETIEMVESGEYVDVQFRIVVRNEEPSVASNVHVIFEDGVQVNVGDVAPDVSATSAPERRIVDTSATPTRHIPVPVTVRFSLDGVDVESMQTLVVDRPTPEGEGQ